jgi:2-oxoglutarate ferredoxin oxidoreductase subunit gamma
MNERILIAGSGGQGIISLGKLMALAAMETIEHVTFFPAYGAEVRGGTSNCQIILSSKYIASPLAEEFDCLLAMNQQSAERFLPALVENGIAVINSSLCSIARRDNFIMIDASRIAEEAGNVKVANIVMLGAMLAKKPIIETRYMEEAIRNVFKDAAPAILTTNITAFHEGLKQGAN